MRRSVRQEGPGPGEQDERQATGERRDDRQLPLPFPGAQPAKRKRREPRVRRVVVRDDEAK